MILLYSKFDVDYSLTKDIFFQRTFQWIDGMRNAPDQFKGLSWDGAKSEQILNGKSAIEYEIDQENAVVALRVRIVDENQELWTTDLVLEESQSKLQIRLAREMPSISAKFDTNFRLPFFLRKLIEDGYGGMDTNLRVSDKPFFIDISSIEIAKRIINHEDQYNLPVIYISHPFTKNEYELDVEELAKDLAGSAHVLVESNSEISRILRDNTAGRNPYNGAIDIYYGDESLRYLRHLEQTPNQYRYRIAHSIFSRSSMLNINDEYSLTAIRIRNKEKELRAERNDELELLQLEIEDLKEKRKLDQDIIAEASGEIKELQQNVSALESKVQALQFAFNKSQTTGKTIELYYTEEELYEDEIKRFVLDCIKKSCDCSGTAEQAWRRYHVLNDLLCSNSCSQYGDNLKQEIESILRRGKLNRSDLRSLKALGFAFEEGGHGKLKFHNDDRYTITLASTPSDYRNGENAMHDAIKLLFGV